MSVVTRTLILSFSLVASLALAAGDIRLEKVKTAILPSGGFFSIYEGTCHDSNVVSVASLDSMRRWCINASGELACARNRQEALRMACASADLAAAQDEELFEGGQ